MPLITLLFAIVLVAQGLYAYFSATPVDGKVSPTALIPAFFGVPMLLAGLVALNPRLRKHAMHAAVSVGLLGALAAWGRGASKMGVLFSQAPLAEKWPTLNVVFMALWCSVFVGLCVNSFIAARKRQRAKVAQQHST